eukprot:snap_masked-scaffold_110-processed-gene-0.16-mRNA-1 protein AED:1.00 eAED:1.00 QI:0/0/0/0/1/1/4/0/59
MTMMILMSFQTFSINFSHFDNLCLFEKLFYLLVGYAIDFLMLLQRSGEHLEGVSGQIYI